MKLRALRDKHPHHHQALIPITGVKRDKHPQNKKLKSPLRFSMFTILSVRRLQVVTFGLLVVPVSYIT